MSRHDEEKRIELADGVGYAIDALVSRAAEAGEMIWTGEAVQQLRAKIPDMEMTGPELAEALLRAAAARGVAVAVQKAE